MDSMEAMRAFIRVAEANSFSEAARRLNVAPPVVTRAVQLLEARVGLRLFNRTTRRVVLTEAGERYLSFATRTLAEFDELEATLRGEASGEVSGVLRLSMPVALGTRYIVPLLADFKLRHPKLHFDLDFCDHLVDPVSRGFDAAVRVSTRLVDSSLSARRIASSPVLLAASPSYLARHGTPVSLDDLRRHQVLEVLADRAAMRLVGGELPSDERTVRANSAEALKGFAVAGLGLLRAPAFVLADELGSGRLVRVLAGVPLDEYVVSIVFPNRTMMPVRLRRVIDHLARGLASLSEDVVTTGRPEEATLAA